MVQFDQLKLVCITGYLIHFSEEDIAEFRKSVISHSHNIAILGRSPYSAWFVSAKPKYQGRIICLLLK